MACGAAILIIISIFCKVVYNLVSRKQKTKVRMDEDTVLDVEFKYKIEQNIDDNLELITARFWCDIIDYDYSEISWTTFKRRFTETVFDYIIPKDEKLKGVTNVEIEKVTLQSSKEQKFRPGENKKPVMSANQLQGKTSLYDTSVKKARENNPKFRSATALHGQEIVNQNSIIMNKIQGNLMQIILKYEYYSERMHAINIGDNIVITMYHLMCTQEDKTLVKNENYIGITGRYLFGDNLQEYTLTPIIEDKARDILVLRINEKTHPPKPSIVKYIRSEHDAILPLAEFRTYSKVKGNLLTEIHRGTTTPFQLSYDIINLEKGITTYVTEVMTTHGIVSRPGCCGLPLYSCLSSNSRPIIGLHYGASINYIQAVQITQEYIKDQILPQITNMQSDKCISYENEFDFNAASEFFYECDEIIYEGPDKVEERVWIDRVTYDLMSNLNTDPANGFDCLDDGEHTEWFGYTNQGARSHRLKPKYIPTPYSEEVAKILPVEEHNAVTDNKKVIDPSQLPCDRRGNPSIMIGQQNKLNDPVDAEGAGFGRTFLKQAQELLIKYQVKIYGGYNHRILTDLEVINGLHINPREALYANLEPIAMDGACGANLTSKFKITQKGQMFTKLDTKTASGRDMYWWADTPAANYCRAQQALQNQFWLMDKRCESLVQSNLKCELRPIEKVKLGKTRVFESFNTATSNNTRKYLGTIFAAIKAQRAVAFTQIGIDTIDFQQLYQRFKKVGDYGEAGDFSAWDKHLLKEAMELVPEIWTEVYMAGCKNVYAETDRTLYLNVIKQIITSNYKAIIIADGHVFTKDRGNCSGSQTTTPLNGVVNELYRVALILYIVSKHNTLCKLRSVAQVKAYYTKLYEGYPDLQRHVELADNVHEQINISSVEDILKITDFIDYGDDLCSVISAKYIWLLNFVIYQKMYKYLFGITYDSPAKDGTIVPYTKITDMSFISRTMHLDSQLNVITPRLKLSSVTRLLHWTTDVTFAQLTTNLTEIFDELVMYDVETWNKYAKIVDKIINPYLQRNFGNTFIIPSYNMKRQYYQHAVRFRTEKSSSNAELDRNCQITEEELLKIFSGLVLEGVSESRSSSILSSKNIKMSSENASYPALTRYVASQFDKAVSFLPDHLKLIISGQPALLINQHGQEVWSISCTGLLHSNLDEYEKEIKRVLSTQSEINLQFIDVCVALIMAPQPSHRIQFKMRPKLGHKFLRLDNTRVSFSNLKLESFRTTTHLVTPTPTILHASSAADVDPVPQVSTGVPIPIQDSGVPVELSAMGYSQVNTLMKAYTYTPLMNINIPVGSTYGKVIANLKRGDLINQFMINSKTGDNEYMGSFKAKVVNQVNPGLTGTILVGMTKQYLEAPTENDLLVKQYYHLDGNTSHNVELTISPFADKYLPTRFKWPILAEDDQYYPCLVILVKTDFVSTFDNPKLYSQVQIYTGFHADFISFYNGTPSENNYIVNKKLRSPGEIVSMASILGPNVRFYTDGSVYGQDTLDQQILQPMCVINDYYGVSKVSNEIGADVDGSKDLEIDIKSSTEIEGYLAQNDVNLKFKVNGMNPWVKLKIKSTPKGLEPISVTDQLTKDVTIQQKEVNRSKTYMILQAKPQRAFHYRALLQDFTVKNHRQAVTTNKVPGYAPIIVESAFNGSKLNDSHNYDRINIITVKNIIVAINNQGRIEEFQGEINLGSDFELNYDINMTQISMEKEDDPDAGYGFPRGYVLIAKVIVSAIIQFPLEFETIYQNQIAKFENFTYVPSGCSSLQCLNLPLIVSPPSEGAVTAADATLLPTLNLAETLSRYFDSASIYTLAVTTSQYNQTLFTFVYHGPSKCCFINTRKIEYLVCTELSQNLKLMLVSVIPINSQLPVTSYDAGSLINREVTTLNLQVADVRKFKSSGAYKHQVPTRLEAAIAGALVGGGLLSGLGSGLSSWGSITAQKEMLQAHHKNKLELQQNLLQFYGGSLQQQFEHQLKLSQQNHLLSYTNHSELMKQNAQQQKDHALFMKQLNGFTSPAMMRQTGQLQEFRSVGHEYPGTQQSTQLETPIEQFDLHTGARIRQQPPMHTDDASSVNTEPPKYHTLLEDVEDDTKSQSSEWATLEREDTEPLIPQEQPTKTPRRVQNPPKNKLANSHGLGAEPGTKLRDLSFPSVSNAL